MKLQIFAVLDQAVNAFLPPFHSRAKGEAIRSFSDAVNDKEHQFFRHSTDYILFHLGEFDDGSGMFSTAEPVRVVSARECLVDDPVSSPGVAPPVGRSNGRVAL